MEPISVHASGDADTASEDARRPPWSWDRLGPAVGVLALVSFLWGGCARFEPQPLAPQDTAAAFQRRSLSDDGLRRFIETNMQARIASWPMESWDLGALTFAAFYFHPELEVARAKWAVATAGQRTAGERPNPTLAVTPGYNTTSRIPSPWLVTPSLDVPIETAGKRGYRLALARHQAEAAQLNVTRVAWQVRSRVRSSLLGLYGARETEALLGEQLALQSENVRLLKEQQEAGAISGFELAQARLAASSSELALQDARRQHAESLAELADALGVPSTSIRDLQFSFAGLVERPVEIPMSAARRQALLSRADILGALADYAARESALQLEIARQYPDVHLNPGYEFDQGDNKWMLGLSMTLPVLNRNQGAIAEAEARRAEAAATFNAVQARVVGEIDRAVAVYEAAVVKWEVTDVMQARLQEQEKAARAMLDAGAMSQSDVVASRLLLGAAALAGLDAHTRALQALGALEDAVQQPLGSDPPFDATLSHAPPNSMRETTP